MWLYGLGSRKNRRAQSAEREQKNMQFCVVGYTFLLYFCFLHGMCHKIY